MIKNRVGRRRSAAFAVSFLFLVLTPKLLHAETAAVVRRSLTTDDVLKNIANSQRKLWNDKMTAYNVGRHSATAKGDPWRRTDPTGVYSPVKAASGRHKVSKRDLPFIYQSPPTVPCRNAASTSIISGSKAVDFASFALGILTLVININNNINNNNNNNNNINLNAVDSSNIVANFNTNNANQVSVLKTFLFFVAHPPAK